MQCTQPQNICIKYIPIPTNALGFMAVILLHVGHHYATKLRPQNQSAFAGLLIYFMHLIHARNMEDIKQNIYSKYPSTITSPNYIFPKLHIYFSSSSSVHYVPPNIPPSFEGPGTISCNSTNYEAFCAIFFLALQFPLS